MTTITPRSFLPGRRGRSTFVAVSASLALLLSACGDDPGDGASRTPVSAADSTVGAADLPVIAVSPGSNGGATAAAPEAAGDAAMSTRLAYIEYVLGIDLPALDSDATAWKLVADVDPAAVAALAAALGLSGDITEQPADWGGGWLVGSNDGTGPSLNVSTDGMASWWYSGDPSANPWNCVTVTTDPVDVSGDVAVSDDMVAESKPSVDATEPGATEPSDGDAVPGATIDPSGSCETPEPPAGVPTADEAEAKMRDLLVAWGVDPALVEFETYADDWNASVTAYLLIGGQRSPIVWGASFGGDGALMYANGVLAEVEAVGEYPRIGADAGFERLTSGSFWWGGGLRDGVSARAEAPSGGSAVAADGNAVAEDSATGGAETVETVEAPPMPVDDGGVMPDPVVPFQVTITGVEEELWMLWDVDGTVWLVPGYTFTSDDGGRYSVPAIPDVYLDIQEPMPVEPMPVEPMPVDPAPGDTIVGGDTPISDGDTPADLPVDGGINSLVGLSEDEANKVIESVGWNSRVVARDGEQFAVTMDYRTDRVNLEIVDGIVTAATIG